MAGTPKPPGAAATPVLTLPGAIGLPTPIKPVVPAEKTLLKTAELNQTVFAAPGPITLAAMLSGDHPSNANCSFYANVYTATDDPNGLNTAVGSPTVLSGSLPGLVGPVSVNLQPGKYRVDFAVKDEATSACKGSTSRNFEVKRAALFVGQATPTAQIISAYTEMGADKLLKVSVLANGPAVCDKLSLDIDGRKQDIDNVKFPLIEFVIYPIDRLYPNNSGKHTFVATGSSTNCKGSATSVFNTIAETNISNVYTELAPDKALKLSVLATVPAVCGKLTLDIDGAKKELTNIKLPLDGFTLPTTDSFYPKTGGKHTLTVTGDTTHCKGSASSAFSTVVVAPPAVGSFVNFNFTNMDSGGVHYLAGQPLQMNIFGAGSCQLDVAISHQKTGALWTRRVAATFTPGKPFHYVGDVNMPAFGHFINAHFLPLGTDNLDKEVVNDSTYIVKVTPVAEANSICVGLPKVADYRTHCRDARGCYPSGYTAPGSQSKNKATAFTVSGFTEGKADGKLVLEGTGTCRIELSILDLNVAGNTAVISANSEGSGTGVAVPFPYVKSNLGPLKSGKYRAYSLSYDKSCEMQGPDKAAGGWYVDFKVGNGVSDGKPNSSNNGNNGNGNGTGVPPGGSVPGAPKPATGNITNLQVPSGSFAEDETQRLQVSGSGGCAMDLRVWNTAYGGNFDKTFDVKPLALAASPSLFNGTNFDTLAEGSWSATVTGKNSCTGSKQIDFKVTAKTSTAVVHGKPTLTLDKPPLSGDAFKNSKDSNIWFKVSLPPSIKSTQYASCCDIEFNYKNSFGGWEVLPGSPFNDPSWSNAMTLPSVATFKSVNSFKVPGEGAMEWRMKVRAYKFKTQFDWSDWLEFKVDQN